MKGWFRRKPRDTGLEEARQMLADAHAQTPEVKALAASLAAKRRANGLGPKIEAALRGKPA